MPLSAYRPSFQVAGLFLGLLLCIAHADNPPTGFTGAPFDRGTCNQCHSGGGFSGVVSVHGLPAVITPDTDYFLEVQLSPSGGHPSRGGFQLVAVDGDDHNAGDLAAADTECGVEFWNGRAYLEHRAPKSLASGGPATWAFRWRSPSAAARDTIRFFVIGNFCDGDGNSDGDVALPGVHVFRFGSDTSSAARYLPADQGLRVFPNPAAHWVHVSTSDGIETLAVELIDPAGRLARSTVIASGDALHVSDLAPGAYTLRVRGRDGVWQVQRFIRQ
ncbi:MAG: T9SS type A sorting domain-containing protein [Saprospiraceae bacterium]|nr:T9SS type A sorting domain-containing protein [Saprospiraceae bacterium]MDW8228469.1 T9SS type A sorting domain-containing protein [Saprospiraceae bacterium]